MAVPRIAITAGEPAGIGPDIVLLAAQRAWDAELVVIADPGLLQQRAQALQLPVELQTWTADTPPQAHRAGTLKIQPVSLAVPTIAGTLDPANATYVIETLRQAVQGCLCDTFQAMVTGPVQKSVINDAGIPFIGHTEFLAARDRHRPGRHDAGDTGAARGAGHHSPGPERRTQQPSHPNCSTRLWVFCIATCKANSA